MDNGCIEIMYLFNIRVSRQLYNQELTGILYFKLHSITVFLLEVQAVQNQSPVILDLKIMLLIQ